LGSIGVDVGGSLVDSNREVAPVSEERRAMNRIAATLALFAVLIIDGRAQPIQRIYLQYDGFVKNANGTYTLSFGYFNTNQADVTIEAGSENSFLPAPEDRNQPITFRAGRHRFSCSVVMPAEFNGGLQWKLTFAGYTSTTTMKLLDPLYELEKNSADRATAGLDLTKTKFGICTNRAPSVEVPNRSDSPDDRATGLFTTRLDAELSLNGQVSDDGLPRGSKLAIVWKKISGPGGVAFSSTTTSATRAKFSAPGNYELELSAADGEHTTTATVKVAVGS
jgi:hypothetical protein